MGISTSPSRPWNLGGALLLLLGSIGIRFMMPDPVPQLGILAPILPIVGFVAAAILALEALVSGRLAWGRPAAMIVSTVGLVVAVLAAATGARAVVWPVLSIGIGSCAGLLAFSIERTG